MQELVPTSGLSKNLYFVDISGGICLNSQWLKQKEFSTIKNLQS